MRLRFERCQYGVSRAIKVGEGDVFIAGGLESMSRGPYSVPKAEMGYPWGNLTMWDTAFGWRYPHPEMEAKYGTEAMGKTAENINDQIPFSRTEQDAFALRSHQRAIAAIDDGRFAEEIVPVSIPQRKGDPVIVDTDERPRRGSSMEALERLQTCFPGGWYGHCRECLRPKRWRCKPAPHLSDEKAAELGLKPMARVVASAAAGVAPRTMGLGPVPATQKVLSRAGISLDDIGLIELNEAFAVQSLAVMQELGMNPEIVNVNGGAIALGHPLGCSGARILTTLLHEMKRRAPDEKRPYYGLQLYVSGLGRVKLPLLNGWMLSELFFGPSVAAFVLTGSDMARMV